MSYLTDLAEQIKTDAEASALAAISTPTTSGSTGHDTLYGDPDNNRIDGDSGSDTILGFEGDDFLKGDGGNDSLFGNNGADYLNGGAGDDHVRGGAGDDFIDGNTGNDNLDGGTGNDILAGGTGNDTLKGHSGNDTLYGGTGADILWGGKGDDTLVGDEDDLKHNGGEGFDTLIVDDSDGDMSVDIDLRGKTNIEAVIGADQFDPGAGIDTTVTINLQRLLNDTENSNEDGDFSNTFIAIGIDSLIISDGDIRWRNGDSSADLMYSSSSVSLADEQDIEAMLGLDIADNSLYSYTFMKPTEEVVTVITDLLIDDFSDARDNGFSLEV